MVDRRLIARRFQFGSLGTALDHGAPSLVAFDAAALVAMRLPAPRPGGRPLDIRLGLVRVAGAGAWDEVIPSHG